MDVYKWMEKKPDKMTVVVSKRQVGKSVLAECLVIKYALEKRCLSCIVEPTLDQSRRVFKEIVNMLQGSGAIHSANATLLNIVFSNGSELLLKSAEQQDNLRGMAISGLLVIDEGAFISDAVYEILFPTVDANNAPIIIFSTPLFKSGMFYNLYMSEDTKSFDWSKYDTSVFLPSAKLEMYRRTYSPMKFRSEYLGLFIDEGGFVFQNIGDCTRNTDFQVTPRYCGIDWATGSESGDYTVVTLSDEENNADMLLIRNMQPMEQIERIADELNARPSLVRVLVEENSIGKVYMDALRRKLKRPSILSGFNTTNDSKRRVIEALASEFEQRHISIPDNEEVTRQLQYYAVEKTKKGYTYNAVNGAHDDVCISLALALEAKRTNTHKYKLSF